MVSALCDKLLRPFQFLYRRDQDLAFGSNMLWGGGGVASFQRLSSSDVKTVHVFTDDVAGDKARKKKIEIVWS